MSVKLVNNREDSTMMNLAKSVAYMSTHQFQNVLGLVQGRPLTTPSLGSMTLDGNDVRLAKMWLKNRQDWYRYKEIEEYHTTFATWNGSAHAFSFMAGRVALSAVIYALGLKPGDEVILPGYTCVVVPNAFHYEGIKTVYSDIELDTYGLDAPQIETKITPRTKAILLHHLYGLVCRDYEEIIHIARRHNLYVIEDCAHSTGAEYKGKKVGNLGQVAFYSSEQSKVFNTVQGGMATTNDDRLARKIQEFYDQAFFPSQDCVTNQLCTLIHNYYRYKHPQRWWLGDIAKLRYQEKVLQSTTKQEELGIKPSHYGRKMNAPIAAIGLNQLAKIDRYNEQRRQAATIWDSWCNKYGYHRPLVIPNSVPVYLRYPVCVEPEKKENTAWALHKLKVSVGVWFVSHIHPVNYKVSGCPNADRAVKQCINFPTLIG